MPKRSFEKLLLEAVDEGLSWLGDSSRQAIYFHMEKNFGVKKPDIPRNIKAFENAIERIFGDGANYLEVMIMRRLYEKVGGTLELSRSEPLAFSEYVSAVKQSLQGKTGGESGLAEVMSWKEIENES